MSCRVNGLETPETSGWILFLRKFILLFSVSQNIVIIPRFQKMEVIILSFFLSKSLIALNKEMQKSGSFLFHQSYCYDFRFLHFFSFCRRNKNCRILPKNRNLFFWAGVKTWNDHKPSYSSGFNFMLTTKDHCF